jgi:ATP-grasp domain-containing protein/L-aminoacid ligase-like protein
MKRLLLFTSKLGYQTRSFEQAAKQLGVELVYVTDRCHQLDDPWNDRAIPVHFEHAEAAAYIVMERVRAAGAGIDGVLALGDRPAQAAAFLARGLGLRFHHPGAVEACRIKLRTRQVLRDASLPVPWFRAARTDPVPEPSLLGVTYPCVLKPVSLSASQGVIRANTREEFLAAAARIARLLATPEIRSTREPNLDQLLVEGYLPGREVAVEGLLTEGKLRILATFDKPDPLTGPFFEETIYVTPSRLSEAELADVERCAVDSLQALGLSDGPVHAEFRVNDGGVWPIEVAPRPIGGLCSAALRFQRKAGGESMSFEELLLRHTLELPNSDCLRERAASGVMMIPVPSSGVLESVQGEEAARGVSGITQLMITARLHDYIAAWPEGSSYLGFLFASGMTAEDVERSLREAHLKLKFGLVPRLPVEHPATGGLART